MSGSFAESRVDVVVVLVGRQAVLMRSAWARRRQGDGRAPRRGSAASSVVPRVGARRHREQRVQEVLGRGVLVEAPRQVGDGGFEVAGARRRPVQQQAAGGVGDGRGLRRRHAFEHLDLEAVLGAVVLAQRQRPRDVEQVVRRHADAHGVGVLPGRRSTSSMRL